jgi:hypothetical protein
MDGVVAIEDAMYDRASNEGYHSGIADCKEHDPAHEREAAAPAATEALRAALAALLDHHDNTCRVSGGPGSECIVRDEARAVLRAALASPEPTPEPEHDINCGIDALRLGEDIGCTCYVRSESTPAEALDPLRSALERLLAVAMTEEEDVSAATQDEWIAAIQQANEALAESGHIVVLPPASRLQEAEALLERALYLPSMESEDRDLTLTAILAFFDDAGVSQERPQPDEESREQWLREYGAQQAEVAQERPPIDVVRLAKAMALVYVTGHPIHEAVEHWESYRTDATELIAAYGAAEELDD